MAKKKNIKGYIKLLITPGEANPSPPIGPALGQRGVNIVEFCKAFNEKTKDLDKSIKVRVKVIFYEDHSFDLQLKTPPASRLILKMIGSEKGSSYAKRNKIGKLSHAQIKEIAKIKMPDLTATDLEAAIRVIAGTARSMGVEIEEEK